MHGWCGFGVTAGNGNWQCCASWLGNHPICDLMMIAVAAHQHYFHQAYPADNAFRSLEVEDEPGGIEITFRFLPEKIIEVRIEQYKKGTLKPDADEMVHSPYYIGQISLRQLIEEAYRCGARLLRENGLTGTRVGWCGWQWDSDPPACVFPVDYFIFLSEYIHAGEDVNFVSPTIDKDLWHIQQALKNEDVITSAPPAPKTQDPKDP